MSLVSTIRGVKYLFLAVSASLITACIGVAAFFALMLLK
jgi:hypothetical protein